jgi:hypothetical protein
MFAEAEDIKVKFFKVMVSKLLCICAVPFWREFVFPTKKVLGIILGKLNTPKEQVLNCTWGIDYKGIILEV